MEHLELVLPAPAPGTANVPAFLAKLWKMVDDPSTNHLISWSEEGNSFVIHNQTEFAHSLLPYYYKHSNMASFVRQLNMYGFHKVVGIESGGLKSEKQEEMEFAHNYFIRGMEMLLEKIKRKVSSNKSAPFVPSLKTERVNEMLSEVSTIRERQEEMDSKLDTMKSENEALWKEVVSLRQKHHSQQKIVNKLIHFLVSMVQPRAMGNAVKRRYGSQLAIADDSMEPPEKGLRLDLSAANQVTGLGPIISDVTHESVPITNILSASSSSNSQDLDLGGNSFNVEMPDTPDNLTLNNAPPSVSRRPTTPVSAAAMRAVDPSLVNPAVAQSNAKVGSTVQVSPVKKSPVVATSSALTPKRPVLHREISKEDFDLEMNVNQKELDNLKDFLSGQVTIDSNFLSSLFNPDDPYPNIVINAPTSQAAGDLASGQEGAGSKLHLELDNGNKGGPTDSDSFFEIPDYDESVSLATPQIAATPSTIDNTVLNTPKVVVDDTDPLVAIMKKK